MSKATNKTADRKNSADSKVAKLSTSAQLPIDEKPEVTDHFPKQTGRKIHPLISSIVQEHDILALGLAWGVINELCFNSQLAKPVISYAEKGNGGFKPSRYETRKQPGTSTTSQTPIVYGELSINPELVRGLTTHSVLLNLIHQMIHQYMYHTGESTGLDYRNDFHKAAYIQAANDIGLAVVGKGRKIDLLIQDRAGKACLAIDTLLAKGWMLKLDSIPEVFAPKSQTKTTVKLVCACGESCVVKRRDDGTFPQMFCGACNADVPQKMIDEASIQAELDANKDETAELSKRAAESARMAAKADAVKRALQRDIDASKATTPVPEYDQAMNA